jgi:hypothetical protein
MLAWPLEALSPKAPKSHNASTFFDNVSRTPAIFSVNPSRNRALLSSRRPDVLNSLQLRRQSIDAPFEIGMQILGGLGSLAGMLNAYLNIRRPGREIRAEDARAILASGEKVATALTSSAQTGQRVVR